MKRQVIVTQVVEVEIDETKFTPDFMAEFDRTIFAADLDRHFEHLAQLHARGIFDEFTGFIEGYGPPAEMGIKAKVVSQEEEIIHPAVAA